MVVGKRRLLTNRKRLDVMFDAICGLGGRSLITMISFLDRQKYQIIGILAYLTQTISFFFSSNTVTSGVVVSLVLSSFISSGNTAMAATNHGHCSSTGT